MGCNIPKCAFTSTFSISHSHFWRTLPRTTLPSSSRASRELKKAARELTSTRRADGRRKWRRWKWSGTKRRRREGCQEKERGHRHKWEIMQTHHHYTGFHVVLLLLLLLLIRFINISKRNFKFWKMGKLHKMRMNCAWKFYTRWVTIFLM